MEQLKLIKEAEARTQDYLSRKGDKAVVIVKGGQLGPILSSVRELTDNLTLQYLAGEVTKAQYVQALLAVKTLRTRSQEQLERYLRLLQGKVVGQQSKCAELSAATRPTPPPPHRPLFNRPAASEFVLVGAPTIENTHPGDLTIDAEGGTAHLNGGYWSANFTFKVPRTLTTRENSSIELSAAISANNENPEDASISAIAPDFNQELNVLYPDPGSASQTYVLKTASLKDMKEFTITIYFISSKVTYTYRRSGT